jgi:mono/diheme cytochrome c family protein
MCTAILSTTSGLALPVRADSPTSHNDGPAPAFFDRHCLTCHSGEEPEGEFALDRLSGDFANPKVRERWLYLVKRVEAGEMPPEEKPRPPEEEVRELSAWVRHRVDVAIAADRAAHGRAVMRRLNRAEYENTVRELLGIHIELQDMLPLDTSAHGFDNVGEALHTSSFLMERYLEAADAALDVAIANLPQPRRIHERYLARDQHQVKTTEERVYRQLGDTTVFFSSSLWNSVVFGQFYPPDRGKYRFRISTCAVQSDGQPVTLRIDAGPMLMATKNHLIGYFDVPAAEPTVIEFTDDLAARSTIRLLPHGLATAHVVNPIGADKYEGPGLAIEWVEVEGPLHDSWPPESHRRIFGDLAQRPAPNYQRSDRVEVVSENPATDAERILRSFASRAFRRPVTDDELAPFLRLFEGRMAEGYSFEQAVRVGLKGIMVSPNFLFLREPPGKLDDYALASRLSYFLWSTMPDEPLLALAADGKLSQPDILRDQVERMLADPKSRAFTENFVGQWLKLRDIDFTEPDPRLYPEYDELLRTSMVDETHLFFGELLREDLSIANFIASDFSFLNERLARHYGIEGLTGTKMQKVPLPPESHRGGVLTMASVLKVTANGTNTSPVVRGAWVLDRILGTPPTPPPDGVPAIEPDIRGATTIREQLAKHRQIASCATCHTKIDPPGFALESFDVIGGWRDNYRSVGRGEEIKIDGRSMPYYRGPTVDPSDVLPDGRAFADVDEFKQLLLADKDQIARALTVQLVTYATGHAPDSADAPQVEGIVERVREHDYGFRSLVHEIVQSELFRTK